MWCPLEMGWEAGHYGAHRMQWDHHKAFSPWSLQNSEKETPCIQHTQGYFKIKGYRVDFFFCCCYCCPCFSFQKFNDVSHYQSIHSSSWFLAPPIVNSILPPFASFHAVTVLSRLTEEIVWRQTDRHTGNSSRLISSSGTRGFIRMLVLWVCALIS